MSDNPILQQAIELVKSGDKKSAAALLSELVAREPENEEAWLWLATCAESDNDRAFYLQQALSINPANQAARDTLVTLGWNPPPLRQSAPDEIKSETQKASTSSDEPNMPAYGVEKPAPAKNRGWIIGAIVLLVILLLAAGAFVAFPKLFSTIFRNNGGQPSGPKANPTSQVEGAFPPTWTPEPVASPLPTNTKHPTPTALPSPTQYIMPTYDMTVVWMNAFASATAETYLTAVAALNTPEPGAVNAKPNNNGATVTPVPIDIACYADATSAHVTLTRVGKLVPFDGMNAFWVSPSANKAVRCNSPSNPTGEGMCSWDSADQYTSGITLTVQVVVEGSVLTCTSK